MDCLAIFRTQMSVCGLFVFPHVVSHVSFERSMSLCSLLHRTFQVAYFFKKFGNIFSVTHTLQKFSAEHVIGLNTYDNCAKTILGLYVIVDY